MSMPGIAPRPDRHVSQSSRVPVHLIPSPHFLAALIGIALVVGMLCFVNWLKDEARNPPLNPDEGADPKYALRPNPPACDDAPDLYDCLNTPVNR